MTDPRIAPVEDNLLAFFTGAGDHPMFRRDPDTDVDAIRSDVPFPMFNCVTGAHFGADARRRTEEVADSFIGAGLPWLWWVTPSHTSPELEAALTERGLEHEDVPGMYADLTTAPPVPEVAGLSIEQTTDARAFVAMMVTGFGLPESVREPMSEVMSVFQGAVNVIGSLDGRPVACGTAYLTGTTAGLYNIATLEDVRGRGIGYAVTQRLLQLAHAAGAEHAVLHSSESGRPVYERAGFVEVCNVPQYVWMPPEN
ncbi:GNAT superfamily N-acetyltransferase [Marmoricola sp. URHA0025 HA25]